MSTRTIIVLSGLVAAVLTIIGFRFLFAPADAVRTFGLGKAPDVSALAAIIGIRDLWLAALAAGLAWFREWRALALWFGLGALVCWADATLVASRSGPAAALVFHSGSGVLCALIGWLAWRRHQRSRGG
jgi:divalent metal cation (Fe/Co/Zn/Cd) transporter